MKYRNENSKLKKQARIKLADGRTVNCVSRQITTKDIELLKKAGLIKNA